MLRDRDNEIENLKITLRRVRDTLQPVNIIFSYLLIKNSFVRVIYLMKVVGKVVVKTSDERDLYLKRNDQFLHLFVIHHLH
jgi:hypothetical protein